MTDRVDVQVRRSGRTFEADAWLDLAADAQTVWDTVTDYDALPRFMPGLRSSRVVERRRLSKSSEQLLVEQRGTFRFLLFTRSMTVQLSIEQQARRFAAARATNFEVGPLRRSAMEVFEARYEFAGTSVRSRSPRTRLHYTALIRLGLPPPPAVGSVAVRQNLAAQLDALAAEVARRTAAAAGARD